jgi:hypothetical protein
VAKIASLDLARQEWEMNTDLSTAPVSVAERTTRYTDQRGTTRAKDLLDEPVQTLSEAAAEEKRWKAKRAELDYKVRSGELVPKDDVRAYKAACEARQLEEYSRIRNAALALPTKLKHQLPHLSHKDILVLDGAVRELLEGLADPAANGTAA